MRFLIIISLLITHFGSFGQEVNVDSLLELSKRQKDTIAIKAYNDLYRNYLKTDPKTAFNYTLKALDLALEINDKKGIAACYNNIGVFYKNQGMLDKALSYYLESLELNKTINFKNGIAYTWNNIGTVYSLQDNPDKALDFFYKSYRLLDTLQDSKNKVGALSNIGNAYLAKGEDYRAIGFYKEALSLYKIEENPVYDPLTNIGNAYFVRGEHKRAKKYYEQSLEKEKNNKNPGGQALAHHNLAAIYLATNNLNKAKKHELNALEGARAVVNKPLLQEIHLHLSNIYYEQKNMEEAYNNRVLYDSFKDILHSEEASLKLAQLDITYLLLGKEKEYEVLLKENEVNKLKVENTKIVIILGVMGTIVIMAVAFIAYVIKKNKRSGILHA